MRTAWTVMGTVMGAVVLHVGSAGAEPEPASVPAAADAPAPSVTAAAEAPTPVPASVTVPAPVPASVTATASVPAPVAALEMALVHVAVDRRAWLEGRDRIDGGDWTRRCQAPCDAPVRVEGMEFRVVGDGMTDSNPFAVRAGPGTARLQVAPGSATARTLGIIALAGGLPIAFAGVGLYGGGLVEDSQGMKTAGIVTLAVGAVAVVASLPLLILGSTSVKDDERHTIARAPFRSFAFEF